MCWGSWFHSFGQAVRHLINTVHRQLACFGRALFLAVVGLALQGHRSSHRRYQDFFRGRRLKSRESSSTKGASNLEGSMDKFP